MHKLIRQSILVGFLIVLFMSFGQAQEVKVIAFSDLETLMAEPVGNLRVINFWATWCKPCVAELPNFEKANQQFKGEGVQVILMSLDFAEQLDKRVVPFARKKALKSELYLLDDTNYNAWIDKVSVEWSGAIPATLIINKKGEKFFYERELSEQQLFDIINKHKI